jgi:ketosteroid isomerase-like protein
MIRRSLLAFALAALMNAPALLAADKEEAGVLAAENGWSKGVSGQDYAMLDKFLADDLTYTHSTGATDTKASYIQKLKDGKMRYFKAEYPAEPRVQILGKDAALTFGKVNVVTLGAGGAQTPATLVFLHAFVKRHGQWQLVAHQSAKVQ